MPKARTKIKKSIIAPHAAIIGLADEIDLSICCSNRNCPSHWHDRLTEKLKNIQQSKPKPSANAVASEKSKRHYELPHADVLTRLFRAQTIDESNEEIYSTPVLKAIVLEKHDAFAKQVANVLNETTYSFVKVNLNMQMEHRLVPLLDDIFSDQINRLQRSTPLKINQLRINHRHTDASLRLKVVSRPVWNRSAVHVIVEDEDEHCLHLALYNWSYVVDTRQIKAFDYVQERLINLLPIDSSVVLLDPWLKRCQDGALSLRCDSPNSHLVMIDFEERCSMNTGIDVEQLRQMGNACYQADDNLSAIDYYTYGLGQLDDEQEKELTSKGQSIGPKTDEREQHRIRLLSNRCACYLRERHAALALADTGILLAFNELTHILELPKATTGKLLFRCLSAHLYLGLFDKVEGLLKSHKFGLGLAGGENLASMSILERELIRLKDESTKGRYDLQGMLHKQVNNKSPLMFIDLPHHHAECHRTDLFQVRACRTEEYPAGSYGVFALKNLDAGTLLVVEQPFASVDNRVIGEEYGQAINYWENGAKTNHCANDVLRLLNEIEKQLLVGNETWTTFEKLKCMQPIRQWLAQHATEEASDLSPTLPDAYEEILSERKQWTKPFLKRSSPPLPYIPWRVLFETQQQNPYQSQSTLGWYPLGSMFNHSCLPNCLWYLIGDYLFIYVCSSNVRQGDELTISYCPLWISSVHERAQQLDRYQIRACQCALCLYDRASSNEYESDLKKFGNLRALARQKNLPNANRIAYVQQLQCQYEQLTGKHPQRPIGFVSEFLDIESISRLFVNGHVDNDVREYLHHQQDSFLERLSHVCRVHPPQISNPVFLFGTQIQLLVDHLERSYSSDYKQWNRLLEYLYEIYTFRCHSVSHDMPTTLKDYQELFSHLLQTQTCVQR